MKSIVVLGLLIIFSFFCEAKAQSISTKIVRIEIDGKVVKKNYQVLFLSGSKWIEAERTLTGFIVPDELKTEQDLTFLITFGKYRLEFARMHPLVLNADWVVGVDKKPFSEEFVSPKKAKMVKQVYYIKFSGTVGLDTETIIIEYKNR